MHVTAERWHSTVTCARRAPTCRRAGGATFACAARWPPHGTQPCTERAGDRSRALPATSAAERRCSSGPEPYNTPAQPPSTNTTWPSDTERPCPPHPPLRQNPALGTASSTTPRRKPCRTRLTKDQTCRASQKPNWAHGRAWPGNGGKTPPPASGLFRRGLNWRGRRARGRNHSRLTKTPLALQLLRAKAARFLALPESRHPADNTLSTTPSMLEKHTAAHDTLPPAAPLCAPLHSCHTQTPHPTRLHATPEKASI